MYNINFKEFKPVFGEYIVLPEETLLWRCYNAKYPAISERPTFFGDKRTALLYKSNKSIKCDIFKTKRALNLIDIRYMNVILKEVFKNRGNNSKMIEFIKDVSFSLGLVCLQTQINIFNTYINFSVIENKLKNDRTKEENNLLTGYINMQANLNAFMNTKIENRQNFPDLFDFNGVRIGFTNIDIKVVIILKELFGSYCDGFIAPMLFSPFHMNNINEEILLFNPKVSVIETNLDFNDLSQLPSLEYLDDINKQYLNQLSFKHSKINFENIKIFENKKGGENNKDCNKDNNLHYEKNYKMITMSNSKYNQLNRKAIKFVKIYNILNFIRIKSQPIFTPLHI